MKLTRTKLEPKGDESLEDLFKRIKTHLEYYKSNHKDYTYKIQDYKVENYLIVTNFKEEEEIN